MERGRIATIVIFIAVAGIIIIAVFCLLTGVIPGLKPSSVSTPIPTPTPTPSASPTRFPTVAQVQAPIVYNTPLPTITPIPSPTPTSVELCPAMQQAPYFFEFTYPQPGASVTYPLHIAGYLHPPDNNPVNLNFIVDYGVRATGTASSVPWGNINVVIFSLSGTLPLTSGNATLTVKDAATGLCLAQRQVRLVGEDHAGSATIYLYDRGTGNLVPHERRVPTSNVGSNLALSELFWGLTEQESARYQTFIPSPAQIYQRLGDTDPINAIVHVRDSYVSTGGVAIITLSEGILAAESGNQDHAVEQIQETLLRQFSNVKDVALAVGGRLWKPDSIIVPTPTPVPQVIPTSAVPAGFYINITSPQPNQTVNPLFLVRGNATVPPAGQKLVLSLQLPGGQPLVQNVTVVGAQPGQLGTFDTHISYTGVSEAVLSTLTLSYTDPATGHGASHSVTIWLSPSSP